LKGFRVGFLQHQINIQTPTRVADGAGGGTITWANHAANAWASIEPLGASQAWWAKHLEHRVTHVIHVRYETSFTDAVTSDMRVQFGTRIFHIQGIKNIKENREFLQLICEEGKAA